MQGESAAIYHFINGIEQEEKSRAAEEAERRRRRRYLCSGE